MRINIQYKDLFAKTTNQVLPELSIPQITGITIDSRKVVRGDIFFALKGESTAGHNYIIIRPQFIKPRREMIFCQNATGWAAPSLLRAGILKSHENGQSGGSFGRAVRCVFVVGQWVWFRTSFQDPSML